MLQIAVIAGADGARSVAIALIKVCRRVLATAWMGLFFVQTLLIRSGRRALHQKLGVGGLFVAAGVFLSGVYALVLAIPRLIDLASPADPSVVIAEHLPSAETSARSSSSSAPLAPLPIFDAEP